MQKTRRIVNKSESFSLSGKSRGPEAHAFSRRTVMSSASFSLSSPARSACTSKCTKRLSRLCKNYTPYATTIVMYHNRIHSIIYYNVQYIHIYIYTHIYIYIYTVISVFIFILSYILFCTYMYIYISL